MQANFYDNFLSWSADKLLMFLFSDSDSDSRNLLSTKGEQQKNTVKEQFKT